MQSDALKARDMIFDKVQAAMEEEDDRLIGGYSSDLSFVEK
jgi:hypothetical protein